MKELVHQSDAQTARVDARRSDVDLAHHRSTVIADETADSPRDLGTTERGPSSEKNDKIARSVPASLVLDRNRHAAVRAADTAGTAKRINATHAENVLVKFVDIGDFRVDNGAFGGRENVGGSARVRHAANRLDLTDDSALIDVIA